MYPLHTATRLAPSFQHVGHHSFICLIFLSYWITFNCGWLWYSFERETVYVVNCLWTQLCGKIVAEKQVQITAGWAYNNVSSKVSKVLKKRTMRKNDAITGHLVKPWRVGKVVFLWLTNDDCSSVTFLIAVVCIFQKQPFYCASFCHSISFSFT